MKENSSLINYITFYFFLIKVLIVKLTFLITFSIVSEMIKKTF